MPRGATAEHRAQVVAYAVEHGVTTAAKHYSHGKGTVSKWVSAAGETVSSDRNAAAVAQVRADAEARKVRLAEKLLEIAELGANLELVLMPDAGLRDVVGARTRAIHDHQLISGAATSRSEQIIEEPLDRELRQLVEQVKAQ